MASPWNKVPGLLTIIMFISAATWGLSVIMIVFTYLANNKESFLNLAFLTSMTVFVITMVIGIVTESDLPRRDYDDLS
jgi:FtsH-binding integral membrane protein